MTLRGVSYQWAISLGLLVCVVLAGHDVSLADDADDLIKEVLASSGKGAKAAAELVKIAGDLDSPKNRIRLCAKAYECGISDRDGYESAVAAIDMLLECDPDRADFWNGKLLDIYRLRYVRSPRADKTESGGVYVKMLLAQADKCAEAGKWTAVAKYCTMANSVAWALKLPERQTITDRMRDARSKMMIASRLASLKKALAKDPADLKSRKRLVETCLIDMDQPAEAAKYLNDKLDETLRANVALAAGKTDELSEANLMTLAQWYRKLPIRTVSKTAKAALLTRASDNLTQFLELHTQVDIARVRAASALKAVQAELAKLNAVAKPRPGRSTSRLRGGAITLNLGKGVTMKLARIPAGKFVMGSPKSEVGHRGDEGPMQQITITKPYYIGVTEVTQRQFFAVTGQNPSKSKDPDCPVTGVSFEMCQVFCQAMSKMTRRKVSMPNEALWEYACRAGTQSPFCFKGAYSDLADYAWFRDNSDGKIHPVGGKKPNAWGLYDMHGNAWEHCAAWPGSRQPASVDPAGPNGENPTVVRGGSVSESPEICRSACTYRNTNSSRRSFRVIVTSD